MSHRKSFLDLSKKQRLARCQDKRKAKAESKKNRMVVIEKNIHSSFEFDKPEEKDAKIGATSEGSASQVPADEEKSESPQFNDFDKYLSSNVSNDNLSNDKVIGNEKFDIFDLLNQFPDDEDDYEDDDEEYNTKDCVDKLQEDLRNWALWFNVTHISFCMLLSVLKKHKCFESLPNDARSILKTPRNIVSRPVDPGEYYHIGLQSNLQKIWHRVRESVSVIEILIGIDGLPLFKSKGAEVWPILGSVFNIPSLKRMVFPIGIYFGNAKPNDAKIYLQEFVLEVNTLYQNGIEILGKKFKFDLKGFSMDAPAKAFILNIKGHAGYCSCTKCHVYGHYIHNRTTFPDMNARERTHEDFIAYKDSSFHHGTCPLTDITHIDFIKCFPLDYLHLVCLGIVRTILYIWKFEKPGLKFCQRIIDQISSALENLAAHVPLEFSRKPRSLDELRRWKATEFRQFLLYTGIVVLKDILGKDFKDRYECFLELHVAMTILLSEHYCRKYANYASALLRHFLEFFVIIYGPKFMTHNFHGLIHIAADTEVFGALDNCSTFMFENYLFALKKLVRKNEKPLQQISKRLMEQIESNIHLLKFPFFNKDEHFRFTREHLKGPLFFNCTSPQYEAVIFQSFELRISKPNSCCSLKDGSIVLLENIAFSPNFKCTVILCRPFLSLKPFYGKPLCESSSLGIYEVSNLGEVREELPSNVSHKMVLLPYRNNFVALPLLHSL